MVDSTNPRVLADNIKMLAARGSGSTVEANPEGAATANLEKLGVEGTVYGIPTYTPPNFSTSETDTGIKWIDNSPIYRIVKTFDASDIVSESGGGKVAIGSITPDEVVTLTLSLRKGKLPGVFSQGSNAYISCYLDVNDGILYLHLRYSATVSSDLATFFVDSKIIIDYTKATSE